MYRYFYISVDPIYCSLKDFVVQGPYRINTRQKQMYFQQQIIFLQLPFRISNKVDLMLVPSAFYNNEQISKAIACA